MVNGRWTCRAALCKTCSGGPKNPGGGVIIRNEFGAIGEPSLKVHFAQETWSSEIVDSNSSAIPFLKQQYAQ